MHKGAPCPQTPSGTPQCPSEDTRSTQTFHVHRGAPCPQTPSGTPQCPSEDTRSIQTFHVHKGAPCPQTPSGTPQCPSEARLWAVRREGVIYNGGHYKWNILRFLPDYKKPQGMCEVFYTPLMSTT